MKIVNKHFNLDSEILNKINEKIFVFHAKVGEMPKAVVLGPKEFMSLIINFNKPDLNLPTTEMLIKTNFDFKVFGLEVLLKQTAGIDVIIPVDLAPHFMIGVIK